VIHAVVIADLQTAAVIARVLRESLLTPPPKVSVVGGKTRAVA
jgi:hypothetical protein